MRRATLCGARLSRARGGFDKLLELPCRAGTARTTAFNFQTDGQEYLVAQAARSGRIAGIP